LKSEGKPNHSWGEIIQYLGSMAYGIASNGQTVCLGKEGEVKEALLDSTKRSINPIINEIIDLERELVRQGENKDDRANTGESFRAIKARHQRSRPAKHSKRRAAGTKSTSFRKRLPVSKA